HWPGGMPVHRLKARVNAARSEKPSWMATSVRVVAADFSGANLEKCDLSNARLRSARAVGANMERCDLSDADLTDIDVSDATLERCDIDGAIFDGAKVDGANIESLLGAFRSHEKAGPYR